MPPEWVEDFPRLYDLFCQSVKQNEMNYFIGIEEQLKNPLNRKKYEILEKDLEVLDDIAWQSLKQKILKDNYLTIRDDLRGWYQLFNAFSEAKGYLFLKSENCTEIYFIPKVNTRTPDLCGKYKDKKILLEVKTVNRSNNNLFWIKENSNFNSGHMTAREVENGMSDFLKNKIISSIISAKRQLCEYACIGVIRKIVYLVITLDNTTALDSRNIKECEVFIDKQGDDQVEVKHCFLDW